MKNTVIFVEMKISWRYRGIRQILYSVEHWTKIHVIEILKVEHKKSDGIHVYNAESEGAGSYADERHDTENGFLVSDF